MRVEHVHTVYLPAGDNGDQGMAAFVRQRAQRRRVARNPTPPSYDFTDRYDDNNSGSEPGRRYDPPAHHRFLSTPGSGYHNLRIEKNEANRRTATERSAEDATKPVHT